MLTLPREIMPIIGQFAPVFSERVWDWVQEMIMGAILAPGKRTVSAVLTILGRRQEEQYQNYHRVLNRAVWSALEASQILLGMLVAAFSAAGVPLTLAADETLERRQGEQIADKGVYRDAARSSRKHLVTSYGLRWVSMALLVPVPWSKRVWALPYLTALAPSEKTNQANGHRHKTSIRWVMQMIGQTRRWVKDRAMTLVVDGGLASVELGHRCLQVGVTLVATLRLDASLFDWPEKQPANKPGPKPKKGRRQLSLKKRPKDPILSGNGLLCPGMVAKSVLWISPPACPYGIPPDTTRSPYAGCWSVTLWVSSKPKPSSRLASTLPPCKS